MFKKLLPASLTTLALLTAPVYAQDTTTETETPNDQAAQANDLDLGETGPRVGEQYVKEKKGDWSIVCIKTESGDDPCAMRQLLNGQEGQPLADINIRKLPEGNVAVAGATVVVPLETLLQAQLAMSIDGGPRKRYDYHHCNPVGCIAQLGFTQGDIDAMKAGTTAVLSLVPVIAPNQVLDMSVSLSGFTAGYDAIGVNAN